MKEPKNSCTILPALFEAIRGKLKYAEYVEVTDQLMYEALRDTGWHLFYTEPGAVTAKARAMAKELGMTFEYGVFPNRRENAVFTLIEGDVGV